MDESTSADRPPRTPWPSDFPAVVVHIEYRRIIRHPDYPMAKAGSSTAAERLVADLLDDAAVRRIAAVLGARKPTIVPVHAEERSGRNKIPLAYALLLADRLGLDVETRIVQSSVAFHGSGDAYYRLAVQPQFDGPVSRGREYVIVDDTMTLGGTPANLRGHIETNGGVVILASTLTRPVTPGTRGAALDLEIHLASTTFARLNARHPRLSTWWKREYGHDLDALTEGEAGHLLKAASVDAIRDRIVAARRRAGIAGN